MGSLHPAVTFFQKYFTTNDVLRSPEFQSTDREKQVFMNTLLLLFAACTTGVLRKQINGGAYDSVNRRPIKGAALISDGLENSFDLIMTFLSFS